MKPVIQTKELRKKFGKNEALTGLTASVMENSITGLIGRNGSGKTTLLKILAGQMDITGGTAHVFGEVPMDNLNVLGKMVYSYHDYEYEAFCRLEQILFAYKTMFDNFDAIFAEKLLRYFELKNKMKYTSLSEGMKSIFNFICAISCRTELTLLDEPVLGMDVTVRKAVYEILLRDYGEHPRTFIVSSHLLSEIEGMLSDILLIENGEVLLASSIDDARERAYRVDGSQTSVESFISGKKTIEFRKNQTSCHAVVYETLTEDARDAARMFGFVISGVRPEDLCVYLTKKDKGDELECLW